MQYTLSARSGSQDVSGKAIGAGLWTIQGLLAATFLFAGSAKLTMPLAEMQAAMPVPGWFIYFAATAELLGALGLILPGLLRIRTELTSLAAAGLTIVMIGATTLSLATPAPEMAVMPLVVGILAATVAYGRYAVAPLRERRAA